MRLNRNHRLSWSGVRLAGADWAGRLLVGLVALGSVSAQEVRDDPRETALCCEVGDQMHRFATACRAAGWFSRARQLWWEVVTDYVVDHAGARKGLGHVRLGAGWAPAGSVALLADSVSLASRRRLAGAWRRLAQKAYGLHLGRARSLQTAGQTAAAGRHLQRCLRFQPGDPRLVRELGLTSFEGFAGSPAAVALLRRSTMMRRVCEILRRWQPAVAVGDPDQAMLERAGLKCQAVESEHFRALGELDRRQLTDFAQHMERGYHLGRALFAGVPGIDPDAWYAEDFVLLKSHESYHRVLRANAELFDNPATLEFLLAGTDFGFLRDGSEFLRLTALQDAGALADLALRKVVVDLAGIESEGLREGLGHAVTCLYFGRSRNWILGRGEHRTRTQQGTDELFGDIRVLAAAAMEAAWSGSGTPLGRLAIVGVGDMRRPERLKAWSFVDYALRREPNWMVALDQAGVAYRDARRDGEDPVDIAVEFRDASAGHSLPEVKQSWREFWTHDEPLRTRVLQPELVWGKSARAEARWSDALFELRRRFDLGPVGFYLPGAEQVAANQAPDPGSPRAARLLILPKPPRDPAKGLAALLATPGYRDVLLHPNRTQIGWHLSRKRLLFDALPQPAAVLAYSPVMVFPADASTAVLRSNLDGSAGYPLSLHFFRALAADTGSPDCSVQTADGVSIDGRVVASAGTDLRDAAPGLFVFWPTEPLPARAEIRVHWRWRTGSGDLGEQVLQFHTGD